MEKLTATKLALIFGVLYALMKIVFGVLLWVDPIGFLGAIFPVPDIADFESLLRDRWIANRNLPAGFALLAVILFKQHRLAAILLLMEFGVQFFDVLVLFLAVLKDLIFDHTIFTLIGAVILTVLCLLSGLHLLKHPRSAPSNRPD